MSEQADVLAAHSKVSMGMTSGSPDTCKCGERIYPAQADTEISERRDAAFAAHQAAALSAAGFGLVADAKAEALSEAAERFKQRSDTYHNTMQEIAASREYGLEDIVRYCAYSAEANTTATWLRTQAAKTRATS